MGLIVGFHPSARPCVDRSGDHGWPPRIDVDVFGCPVAERRAEAVDGVSATAVDAKHDGNKGRFHFTALICSAKS